MDISQHSDEVLWRLLGFFARGAFFGWKNREEGKILEKEWLSIYFGIWFIYDKTAIIPGKFR